VIDKNKWAISAELDFFSLLVSFFLLYIVYLLLLEACRQGVLPRVRRRLQEQERPLVKSGAVFCFDENESGEFYDIQCV
jgi:hypothetical protein